MMNSTFASWSSILLIGSVALGASETFAADIMSLPADGYVSGISGNGSVIIGGNKYGAARLILPGGWESLNGPDNPQMAHPWDASFDGSVIAGYNSWVSPQAIRWTSSEGLGLLGTLPGDDLSVAYGVSGDGLVVVGFSYNSGHNDPQAFRWTQSGGIVGLDDGNLGSIAYDTSADGSVIVGGMGSQAFRWTEATGMVGLGHVSGGIYSEAQDVSADGNVVVGVAGISQPGPFSSYGVPFRWTADGGMVSLGHLDPSPPFLSQVFYVRTCGDGSVVVGAGDSGLGGAFIWDETHGIRSLKSALQNEYGVDMTGWSLYDALGISDDCTRIAGHGMNPDGEEIPYLVTIPEPATAAFLAITCAFISIRRRRCSADRRPRSAWRRGMNPAARGKTRPGAFEIHPSKAVECCQA